jgi:hypothetical protein
MLHELDGVEAIAGFSPVLINFVSILSMSRRCVVEDWRSVVS